MTMERDPISFAARRPRKARAGLTARVPLAPKAMLLALALALGACANGQTTTAEESRRDLCAATYGPGTQGYPLCLRGQLDPKT